MSKKGKKKRGKNRNREEEEDEGEIEEGNENKKPEFYKFPRTHHLFAMGEGSSVSRDDLLISKGDQKKWYGSEIIIEEKIDGANLGISIDPKTYQIMAQNRSHYVTKSSAQQFKTLDVWIEEHSQALFKILKNGRFILFGEYCYAKHSILYDRLPNIFVAFDIFDTKKKKFISVDRRNRKLNGSGIPVIREIGRGVFSKKELKEVVVREVSGYTKERKPIEGMYLRLDDARYNLDRCKIVNDGFIQTIEEDGHWSRRKLVLNKIDYELKYGL